MEFFFEKNFGEVLDQYQLPIRRNFEYLEKNGVFKFFKSLYLQVFRAFWPILYLQLCILSLMKTLKISFDESTLALQIFTYLVWLDISTDCSLDKTTIGRNLIIVPCRLNWFLKLFYEIPYSTIQFSSGKYQIWKIPNLEQMPSREQIPSGGTNDTWVTNDTWGTKQTQGKNAI